MQTTGLARRFAVTRHPTAEWLAQQIVEAFPWETAPACLVRDNDGAYGQVFKRRVRAMGIRDRPISPRSPWQNPYAERLIGTLRHDCLDHVVICLLANGGWPKGLGGRPKTRRKAMRGFSPKPRPKSLKLLVSRGSLAACRT
jgi:transposase InsO family protein